MEVSVLWASIDIILERKQGPEFEGKNIMPPKVTGNGLLMMAEEKLILKKIYNNIQRLFIINQDSGVKTQLSC